MKDDPLANWPVVSEITSEYDAVRDCWVLTAEHDVVIDFSQQTGLFDPEKYIGGVTIIGVGGIGCNVAFELLTMGVRNLTLWDDDRVESHNLASQKAYRPADLFKHKGIALARLLLEYGATEVTVYERRFKSTDALTTPLVIGAVDSMASRSIIWEAVKASEDVQLYLDGRLNRETAQVCAVEPIDADWYTKTWLFPDEQAATDAICTERTIVYPATAISVIMCRHVGRWFRGLPIVQFCELRLDELEFMKIGDSE